MEDWRYVSAKPFLKWAGGKCRILDDMHKRLPRELKQSGIGTYIEPFVGGGSVLFSMMANFEIDRCIINDSNKALMDTYRTVRDNPQGLIDKLKTLEDDYLPLTSRKRREVYSRNRSLFNALRKNGSAIDLVETSALFVFLNKTCYNGIFRINQTGEFNVPMGRYSTPRICEEGKIKDSSRAMKSVEIHDQDFRAFLGALDIGPRCFVYVDPPYAIQNGNNGFLGYSDSIFTWEDQVALATCVASMKSKKAKVMISNARHKDLLGLYHDFTKYEITRSSVIGGSTASRRKVTEMIITSYDQLDTDRQPDN